MLNDHLENFDKEELENLIAKVKIAYRQEIIETLTFTEEEFDLLIEHFALESNSGSDSDILILLAEMNYRQHPYSTESAIKFADVLIADGSFDKAKRVVEKELDRAAWNSDLLFLRARIEIREDYGEKFPKYLEGAISIVGKESEEATEMIITAAQDYIDLHLYDNAIALLDRIKDENLNNLEVINDLAFSYERLDRLEESLLYYNRYLKIDPFNDNVWFNVGTIYARELNMERAIEAFDYALAINPKNSSVLYNKAILLYNLEEIDQAIECYLSFLKFEPDNIIALIGIADAYIANFNFKSAEHYLKIILSISPTNRDAKTTLAYIYLLNEELDKAKEYLKQIVGDLYTDYNYIEEQLKNNYLKHKDSELLLYYLVALHFNNKFDAFYIYLKPLLKLGPIWIAKLSKFIPSLERQIRELRRADKNVKY